MNVFFVNVKPALKMKTKTLLVAIVAFALTGTAFAQSWELQYQQADAELNRVYKELRSKLSEQEKEELKKVQLAWLKAVSYTHLTLPTNREV